jgi:hypothetical protein
MFSLPSLNWLSIAIQAERLASFLPQNLRPASTTMPVYRTSRQLTTTCKLLELGHKSNATFKHCDKAKLLYHTARASLNPPTVKTVKHNFSAVYIRYHKKKIKPKT